MTSGDFVRYTARINKNRAWHWMRVLELRYAIVHVSFSFMKLRQSISSAFLRVFVRDTRY